MPRFVAFALFLWVVPIAITYAVGYAVGASKPDDDIRVVAIKQHAKLLRKARWAYMTRRPGLANIYEEGATRVLELTK